MDSGKRVASAVVAAGVLLFVGIGFGWSNATITAVALTAGLGVWAVLEVAARR
jgi:hypothetical protein